MDVNTDYEPPTITVDLSAAESQYDYGESAIALDFSWYGRYKPTVDAILSVFIWLTFIWMVYKKIPGILSGSSMSTEMYYGPLQVKNEGALTAPLALGESKKGK